MFLINEENLFFAFVSRFNCSTTVNNGADIELDSVRSFFAGSL